MRVTEGGRLASAMRDLQVSGREAARLEEIVSSGKKLVRPSDDPAGAGRAVRLTAELRSIEAAEKNGQMAQGELDATDDALQQLSGLLARTRELATQAANGVLSPADRAAMQAEVNGMLGQALTLANREFDGRTLFGGSATDRAAFRFDVSGATTTVVYQGDDVARETPVGDNRIVLGRPGPGPFGGPNGALDALVAFRDALGSADPGNDARAALGRIDGSLDAATIALGDLGARRSELSAAQDALGARSILVEQLRSTIEDADLSTAIVDLGAKQAAYERGMAVIARVLKTSIFDSI